MTSCRSIAACLSLVSSLMLVGSVQADTALFASSEPRAPELLPELTLSLRGHGVLLVARALGDARTALERAAAAQRIGRNVGAGATLWIEREPPMRVRAVAASGDRIFEAPLPAPVDLIEPRVFASVATSVLLEVFGRDSTMEQTPPSEATPAALLPAPAVPAAGPVWATTPTSKPREDLPRRFFLRAGYTQGAVFLGHGATPDRTASPVLSTVDQAARTPQGTLDVAVADRELKARGYACQVQATPTDQLQLSGCHSAVNKAGFVPSRALDLDAGMRVSSRLALAMTARIAPQAGHGTLAHALLGLQLEASLLKPHPMGFWLNGLIGLGVGRIQGQSSTGRGDDVPYATSGLGNARVGLQLGYRFSPNVGLYAGPTLQVGFPTRLFTLDPSFGLEARL